VHYYEFMTGICMHILFLCFGVVVLHYICIGHAKIYIYPTLVSCEKSTGKIANYTGKPLYRLVYHSYRTVYRLYRSIYHSEPIV
jgi:hypothetical protein